MRGVPFNVPYIANMFAFDPGQQPYDPGQSYTASKARQTPFTLKPWPNAVGSLNALLSSPGAPRARAPVAQVNNWSPNPANYLFIAGFSGKSKG